MLLLLCFGLNVTFNNLSVKSRWSFTIHTVLGQATHGGLLVLSVCILSSVTDNKVLYVTGPGFELTPPLL